MGVVGCAPDVHGADQERAVTDLDELSVGFLDAQLGVLLESHLESSSDVDVITQVHQFQLSGHLPAAYKPSGSSRFAVAARISNIFSSDSSISKSGGI